MGLRGSFSSFGRTFNLGFTSLLQSNLLVQVLVVVASKVVKELSEGGLDGG